LVEEGRRAPDFTLTSDSGERVRLSHFRGRPVVLYFYPKDDTPGCTTQAYGIRDAWAEFESHGAVVLEGPDGPTQRMKFRKYGLPFALPDVDHAVVSSTARGSKEHGRKDIHGHRALDS
jgi:peroxiredoxin Q/BCP